MITITCKFPSRCASCGESVAKGDEVLYDSAAKKVFHLACEPKADLFGGTEAETLADRLGYEREA